LKFYFKIFQTLSSNLFDLNPWPISRFLHLRKFKNFHSKFKFILNPSILASENSNIDSLFFYCFRPKDLCSPPPFLSPYCTGLVGLQPFWLAQQAQPRPRRSSPSVRASNNAAAATSWLHASGHCFLRTKEPRVATSTSHVNRRHPVTSPPRNRRIEGHDEALTEEEATWEREEELKAKFPSFFSDPSESRGRDSF
jgi:hypothetical protein